MTMNLSRPFLKISAIHWPPYLSLSRNHEGSLTAGGPMGKFLDIFSSLTNFDFELIEPPDGLWGGLFPNGTRRGIVGMVVREEVEFSIGPFFANVEREALGDLTNPMWTDHYAMFMSRPTISSDVSGFLLPFSSVVWTLVVASLVCVSLVMAWVARWETPEFTKTQDSQLSHAAMWAIQTVSQESCEWLPRGNAGRLLAATWLMASLVFMSSYSGILTAMLTVPRVTIPINNVADLLAQSRMPWKIEPGTVMHSYLQTSEDPVKRELYRRKSEDVDSCWESRHDIADGKFVGICENIVMKKIMSWDFSKTGNCHFYMAKESVYSSILSIMFRTNSSYRTEANRLILRLWEAGLWERWFDVEIPNSTVCLRSPSADRPEGSAAALSLETLSGVFLMLFSGLLAALVIFLLEHLTRLLS